QKHLPKRLMRDRLHRPLLVGRRAACADRKLDRKDPDDSVDQPAGDEAGAGQPLESTASSDLLPAGLSLSDRATSLELRLCAHVARTSPSRLWIRTGRTGYHA